MPAFIFLRMFFVIRHNVWKLGATIALSLFVVGGAYGQQQTPPDPPVCDRTEQVNDAIVAALDGVDDCANVSSTHLETISTLNLSAAGINALQNGDFAGLINLQELDLRENPFNEGIPELDVLFQQSIPTTLLLDIAPVSDKLPPTLDIIAGEDVSTNISSAFVRSSGGEQSPAENYRIEVNDPNAATATVTNDELTVTGIAAGQTIITVTGISGSREVTHPRQIMVEVLWGLSLSVTPLSVTIEEEDTTRLEVLIGGLVQGQEVTLTASVSDESVATARVTSTSRVTLYGVGVGTATVELTASGEGYSTTTTVVGVEVVGICGRTEQVRNAILAELRISDSTVACQNVSIDQLATISMLNLSSAGINALQNGDFGGLINLQALDLSSNALTTLPETIFSGLINLQTLLLSSNVLTTLPEDIFTGLAGLDELDLSGNSFNEGLPELDVLFQQNIPTTLLLDIAPVSDKLPPTLDIIAGEDVSTNISSAFVRSSGEGQSSPAENYRIEVNDPNVATATVTNHTLTVTGIAAGQTIITVTGISGSREVTHPRQIMVKALWGLSLSVIPMSVALGAGKTTDLEVFTSGLVQGYEATLTASVSDESVATARVMSASLVVLEGVGRGTASVTLSVSGAEYSTATAVVNVEGTGVCDRTEQVRDEIMAELQISDPAIVCQDVSIDQLATISTLSLSTTSITDLQDDDFAGLINLQALDLSFNELTTLPVDIFAGLISLQEVNLSSNNLTTLPKNLFAGLINLQEVDLSNNKLTALRRNLFAGLINLQEADLSSNNLTALRKNLFADTVNLEFLHLSNNDLAALPADIFNGLGSLSRLNLDGNELPTLPAGIFADLNLQHLDLRGNPFAEGLLNFEALFPQGVPASLLLDFVAISDGLPPTLEVTIDEDLLSTLRGAFVSVSGSQQLPADGYRVTVGSSNVATATVEGHLLKVFGVGLGQTTMEVVGMRGSQEVTHPQQVTIMVKLAELSVQAVPRVDLEEGETAELEVTIGGVREGYEVTLTATVSDENVAEVQMVSTSRVVLHGVTAGLAEVKLTASGVNYSTATAVVDVVTSICGRTVQVRDEILIELGIFGNPGVVCRTRNIETEQLATISEFDLSWESINALQDGDFVGLTNLQTLYLDNNPLATLSADVFDGLVGLENLYLYNTPLTTLPEDIFDGLINLKQLHLHNNNFATLPAGIFNGLSSLDWIRLDDNAFETLPAGIFAGLNNLREVDLSRNSFATLPEGVFASLPSLRYLYLNNNAFTTLPGNTFAGLSGLEFLDLGRNPLTTLSADAFAGLGKLENLSLSNNSLETLPGGVFAGLTNLSRISLSNNALMTLPATVFAGASALAELALNGNDLETLPEGIFADLSSLRTLRLNDNDLETLPADTFVNLIKLRSLYLSDNALTTLPTFAGLSNLQTLSVPNNALETLSGGIFDGLSSLRSLILSNSALTALPENLFVGLNNLRSLSLSDNALTTLPADIFDGLNELLYLYLLRNPFDEGLPNPDVLPSDPAVYIYVTPILDELPPTLEIVTGHVTTAISSAFVSARYGTLRPADDYRFMVDNPEAATATETNGIMTVTAYAVGQTIVTVAGVDSIRQITHPQRIMVEVTGLSVCDRTKQIRNGIIDVLEIDGERATVCQNIDVDQLATISTLNLSHQGIDALQEGDFAGLTGLQELNLSGNPFTQGLPNLNALFPHDLPATLHLDIAPVLGELPPTLEVLVGGDVSTTIRDAFVGASGGPPFPAENYGVMVGDSGVAMATVTNHIMTVTGVNEGITTIAVSVTGESGEITHPQQIMVTVKLLSLSVTPMSEVTVNEGETVEAEVSLAGVSEDVTVTVTMDGEVESTLLLSASDNHRAPYMYETEAYDAIDELSDDEIIKLEFSAEGYEGKTGSTARLTVTVIDDDTAVTVEFAETDVQAAEGETAEGRVELSEAAPTGGVSIVLTVASGGEQQIGLVDAEDETTSLTVRIDEGVASASFAVRVTDDETAEGEANYQIVITEVFDEEGNDAVVSIGAQSMLTVTVPPNDYVLTATPTAVVVNEGSEASGAEVVLQAASLLGTIEVNVEVEGYELEISNDEGTMIGDAVSLTGDQPATLTLGAANNETYDGERKSTVTFVSEDGMSAMVEATIIDDDLPELGLSATPLSVTLEEGEMTELEILISGVMQGDDVTLRATASDESAVTARVTSTSRVTLYGVRVGMAAVRLTASGENYSTATAAVEVTVREMIEELPELSLSVESLSVTIEEEDTTGLEVLIGGLAQGYEVILTATVSNESVVTAQVASTLRVTLHGERTGTATVELTASGEGYSTATATVNVEVTGICGRTAQVRDEIIAELETISGSAVVCQDVSIDQLATISTLNLSAASITDLQDDDFAGLNVLQALDLSFNELTTLPADIFAGLISLQEVNLSSNNLTTLPKNLFAGLINLQEADLSSNNLTALRKNLFADTVNLEFLHLSNNDLAALPADLFAGLGSLSRLNLDGNELPTLPAGIFADLNLQHLDLRGNPFSEGLPNFDNLFPQSVPASLLLDLVAISDGLPPTLEVTIDEDLSSTLRGAFVSVSGSQLLPADGYRVTVGSSNVATATVEGHLLKVFGVGSGQTTMEVVGMRESQEVTHPRQVIITVELAELSLQATPLSVGLDEGETAELEVTIGGVREGYEVTLTATVSDEDVAEVQMVSTSRVVLHGVTAGSAEVKLTASGVNYSTTTATVDVKVNICGRTVQVRDEILTELGIFGNPGDVCRTRNVGAEQLATISELDLSWESINALQDGDFVGLTNLQTLYLNNNPLATLSADVFDGLVGLENLYLYNTPLTTLPEDIFDGLINLKQLYLHNNNFTTLPEGIFNGLSSLDWIRLDDNALTTLPATVFVGLDNLREVDLSGNSLATLPEGIFADLPGLRYLYLNNNAFTTIPANTFADLPGLEFLDLGGNALTTLSATVFAGQSALVELVLNGNDLETLPEGIFASLTNLNRISLSNNALTTLPATVFAGPSALRELVLNGNDLKTLPAGIFSDLSGLRTLRLNANDLETLSTDIFVNLIELRELYLSDNALAILPTFAGLHNLQTLSIHNNALGTLSEGIFAGLSSLQSLSLSNNALTALPENLFGSLSSLRSLNLNDNALTTLPATVFAGLSDLQSLSLSNNALATLPADIFDGLNELQYLYLQANPFNEGLPNPDVLPSDPSVYIYVTPILGELPPTLEIVAGHVTIDISSAFVSGRYGNLGPADGYRLMVDDPEAATATVTNGIMTVTAYTLGQTTVTVEGVDRIRQITIREITHPQRIMVEVTGLGVCDRTEQIRNSIIAALEIDGDPADVCQNIGAGQLAAISTLNLSHQNIDALQESDFAGLINLQELDLRGNPFNQGLPSLDSLFLHGIPATLFLDITPILGVVPPTLEVTEGEDVSSTIRDAFVGASGGSPFPADNYRVMAGDSDVATATVTNHIMTVTGVNEGQTIITVSVMDGSREVVHPQQIAVTVELPALRLQVNPMSVTVEEGESNVVEVGLVGVSEDATVTVTIAGTGELMSTLLLSASDDHVTTFEVMIFDDEAAEADEIIEYEFSVAGYEGEAGSTARLTVTVSPSDYVLSVTPTAVVLNEGGEASEAEMVLQAASLLGTIAVNVEVEGYELEINDNEGMMIGGTVSLTGDQPVTMTLGAADNNTYDGERRSTVTFVSGDGTSAMVEVTIIDDELELTVEVIPASVMLEEGEMTELEVLIGGVMPGDEVALTATVSNENVVTAQVMSTSSVTLYGAGAGAAMVELTASGMGYGILTAAVDVRVGGICERTEQVRNAVIAMLRMISSCQDVGIDQLAMIYTLMLNGQNISTLQDGDFAGLTGLHSLNLNTNSLTTLSESIFAGLGSLRELDLSDNSLTALPEDVFAGLSSLESLILSNNPLAVLPENIFVGSTNLQSLNLSSNSLTALPENVFAGLSVLEELYLESNSFATLPVNIFVGLSNLRDLNLTGNPFNEGLPNFDDLFPQGIPSLFRLDITPILDELPTMLEVTAGADVQTDISGAFAGASGGAPFPAENYRVMVGESDAATATVTNHIMVVTGVNQGLTTIIVSVMDDSREVTHPQQVMVTVAELAELSIEVTPTSVMIVEGESTTVTISINEIPEGLSKLNVEVTEEGDNGELTMIDSITFREGELSAEVTIAAADNEIVEREEEVTLRFSVVTPGYEEVTTELLVTVEDDDYLVISLSTTELRLVEGEMATVTVSVNQIPEGLDEITLLVEDQPGAGIRLTADNLSTPIEILEVDDDIAEGENREIFTFSLSDPGYKSIPAELTITVPPSDYALSVTPTAVVLSEGSESSEAEVVLQASSLLGTIEVNVEAEGYELEISDDERMMISDTVSLTGTQSATLILRAANNEIYDGERRSTVTFVSEDGTRVQVEVTILEDDVGVSLTEGGAVTTEVSVEAGESRRLEIAYQFPQVGEVQSEANVRLSTEVTVAGVVSVVLDGTAGLTVTGDGAGETEVVLIVEDEEGQEAARATLMVTVELAELSLEVTPTSVMIVEGESTTVTISVDGILQGLGGGLDELTIEVTEEGDSGELTMIDRVTLREGELSTEITIAAADNGIVEREEEVTLRFSVVSARYGGVTELLVTVEDDDYLVISLSPAEIRLVEGESTPITVSVNQIPEGLDEITVFVVEQPSASVRLTVDSLSTQIMALAIDDDIVELEVRSFFTFALSDPGYKSIPAEFTFTVPANDYLSVTPTAVVLNEGRESSEAEIVLRSTTLLGTIEVNVEVEGYELEISDDEGMMISDTVSLTGTQSATLTLGAADNDTYDGERRSTVTFVSEDGTLTMITVTIIDDETAVQVELETTPLAIMMELNTTAGIMVTATVTVIGEVLPTLSVTLRLTVSDDTTEVVSFGGKATTQLALTNGAGAAVTINSGSVAGMKEIAVRAEAEVEGVTYADEETISVEVLPARAVEVSSAEITLAEGEDTDITVSLNRAGNGETTVTVKAGAGLSLSADGETTTQEVTLPSGEGSSVVITVWTIDDDKHTAVSRTTSILLTAEGHLPSMAEVTVLEDDIGVSLTEGGAVTTEVSVEAGESRRLEIAYQFPQVGEVQSEADVRLSTEVTVAGVVSVVLDGTAGLTVTGDGAGETEVVLIVEDEEGQEAARATLMVTVAELAELSLEVTPTSVTVEEGGTAELEVLISGAAPGNEVTLRVTVSNENVVTARVTSTSRVTLYGVMQGTTTVGLTVSGTGYRSATTVVEVSVPIREAIEELPELSLSVMPLSVTIEEGEMTELEVLIGGVMPGNEVTLTATTSDERVVAAQVTSTSRVTLYGVRAGTATVRLTASGEDYSTTTATVNVEVTGICGRTEQVRDAILAALQISAPAVVCQGVSIDQLATISTLSFTDSGIMTLQDNDFAGLTGLQSLNLQLNSLTALPEGIFADQGNLQELDLSINSLTDLPEGIFADLSNLQELDLSHNPLTTLPEGIFADLGNLRELNLGVNPLKVLPEGIFDGLSNLEGLYLFNDTLETLPEDVFAGLNMLQFLHLRYNSLTTLSESIFADQGNLRELDLSNNSLTALPEDIFDGLANLEVLWLDDNALTTLSESIFDGLSNLQALGLDGNLLTTLSESIFADLSNLEELYLDDNSLAVLAENIFDGLTNLEILLLNNNALTTLPANIFADLNNLQYLDLTDNPFDEGLPNFDVLFRHGIPILDLDIAPILGVVPSTLEVTVGEDTSTTIRDAFVHSSGGPLFPAENYRIEVGHSGVATATVTNHIMTVTGISDGQTTILVVVTDDSREVEHPQQIMVTVELAELSLEVTPTSVTIEEDDTNELEVLISGAAPGNEVTLTATTSDDDVVTAQVTSTSLVTLYGVSAGTTTVGLTASGAGYRSASTIVSVTVPEAVEDPLILSVMPSSVTVVEGESATVTISVNAIPQGLGGGLDELTIAVTEEGDNGELTMIDSVTLREGELSMEVTIAATDNGIVEREEEVTLRFSVVSPGYEGATAELLVTVEDDDYLVISLSPTELRLVEGEMTTVTVSVNQIPEGLDEITVFVVEQPSASVRLTADDLSTQIEVLAVDDNIAESEQRRVFTFSLSDPGYKSISAELTVTVPLNDYLSVTPTAVVLHEGSESSRAEVVLQATSLIGTIEVSVEVEGYELEISDDEGMMIGETVSLTDDQPVTLILGVADNDTYDGERRSTVIFVSEDGTSAMVEVTIIDDLLELSVKITPLSVTIEEGEMTEVEVLISGAAPGNEVTLRVTVSNENVVTARVTSTSRVTLYGVMQGTTTVGLTVSGAGYQSATTVVEVSVMIREAIEELPELSLSVEPPSVTLEEEDTTRLEVLIGGVAPGDEVTLRVTVSDENVVTARVTSTSRVTLYGVRVGAATVRLTASGEGYSTATAVVDVEVAGICGRTEEVRNGIIGALGIFSDFAVVCQSVSIDHLATISELVLGPGSIATLQDDDFSGLRGLQSLNLSSNSLMTLSASVFADLVNLQELNLSFNSLTTLSESVFADLSNLRELDLGGNSLTALPEGIFNGLSVLEELGLYSNTLTTLSEVVFAGLSNLQSLRLDENSLTVLPVNIFAGLSSLENLFLSTNLLADLPENIFVGLGNLQSLGLRENSLTTLSENVFAGLSVLEELYLESNFFATLPANIFAGLSNLQDLNLAGNPFNEGLPNFDTLFPRGIPAVFRLDITPILDELPLTLEVTAGADVQTDISGAFAGASAGAPFPAENYRVIVGNSDVATATVTAHTLIVAGQTAGQTTITVIGMDGVREVTHPQRILVAASELTIELSTSRVEVGVGEEVELGVTLGGLMEGQAVTLTATVMTQGQGRVSVDVETTTFITITGLEEGETNVVLTVENGTGIQAKTTAMITVTPRLIDIRFAVPITEAAFTDTFATTTAVTVKQGEPFPIYIRAEATPELEAVVLRLEGSQAIGLLPPEINVGNLDGATIDLYLAYIPTTAEGTDSFRYCYVDEGSKTCSNRIFVTHSAPAAPAVDVDEISAEWDYQIDMQTAGSVCEPNDSFIAWRPASLNQEGNDFSINSGGVPQLPTAVESAGNVDGSIYSWGSREDSVINWVEIDIVKMRYSSSPHQLTGQGTWWFFRRYERQPNVFCWGSYRAAYQPHPYIESVAVGATAVGEDIGELEATITLTHPPIQAVTVVVTIGGTASSDDYSIPQTVAFDAAQTEATFKIAITDDDFGELDEDIELTVTAESTNRLSGSAMARVTIVNDDDIVKLSVEPSSATVVEGGASTQRIVLNAEGLAGIIELSVEVEGYLLEIEDEGGMMIRNGDTISLTGDPSSVTLVLGVSDNRDYDGEQVSTVRFVPGGGTSTPAEVEVRIIDDEKEIQLALNPQALEMGRNATASFTITATASGTDAPQSITLTLTVADGAADVVSFDGEAMTQLVTANGENIEVTVSSGETLGIENLVIRAEGMADNVLYAGAATLPVEVFARAVEINPPEITLEEGASADITVSLNRASGEDTAVTVEVGEGLSLSADGETTMQLVIIALDSGNSTTLTVRSTGEDNEHTVVSRSATIAATAEGYLSATAEVTILEDDIGVSLAEGGVATTEVSVGVGETKDLDIEYQFPQVGGVQSEEDVSLEIEFITGEELLSVVPVGVNGLTIRGISEGESEVVLIVKDGEDQEVVRAMLTVTVTARSEPSVLRFRIKVFLEGAQ